jgi:very-short-patch-repair endonuclease
MAWTDRANTQKARELRINATDAERRLWSAIRNRQLSGIRFNRQVRIGRYICDFAARTPGLVIELDGGQHAHQTDRDEARTGFLEGLNYHVLRFWDHEVMENLDGVVATIEIALKALPQPLPLAGGELQRSVPE